MFKKSLVFFLGIMAVGWGGYVVINYFQQQIDPSRQGIIREAVWGETAESTNLFEQDQIAWLAYVYSHKFQSLVVYWQNQIAQINQIYLRDFNRELTVEELQKLDQYQILSYLQQVEPEITRSLIQRQVSAALNLDQFRSSFLAMNQVATGEKLANLGREFKLGIKSIGYYLIILGLFYLIAGGWQFLIMERKEIKINLTPFGIIMIALVVIYFFYNLNFVGNVLYLPHSIYQKSDLFFIQWVFLKQMGVILAMYILLTITALALGTVILRKLNLNGLSQLGRFLVSHVLGLAGIIFILFFLGIMQRLNIYAVLSIFVLLIALGKNDVWLWLKQFWQTKITFQTSIFSIKFLAIGVLLTLLSVDVITLLRPIPMGWDAITAYQNTARLLAGYGYLISDILPYNWELIVSLGHIIFGSTEAALFLSFYPLIFLFLAVYLFFPTFTSRQDYFLLMALYLSLPMVQHFSSLDMKVENALFYFSLMGLFMFFQWLGFNQAEPKPDVRWLYAGGFLLGVCFGIKLTALYTIFAVIILLAYRFWGVWGAITLALGQLFGYSFSDRIIYLSQWLSDATSRLIFSGLILGLFLIGAVFVYLKYQKQVFYQFPVLLLFLFFIALPMSPWLVKNSLEYWSYAPSPALTIDKLLRGYNQQSPNIQEKFSDLQIDITTCPKTAYEEEIGRYMGRDDSWWQKYLFLPWRMTMNTETKGYYVNISFVFLAILPFLLFFLDKIWQHQARRYLFLFTILYLLLWCLSAGQGVIWYALVVFFSFLVGVSVLKNEYLQNKISRFLILIAILLAILFNLGLRLKDWVKPSMLNFTYGRETTEQVVSKLLPDYNEIRDLVARAKAEYPDRFYLYRVGTFVMYFLNESDQVIAYNDNQLDFFNCLSAQYSDVDLVYKLKQLGVRYFMVDLFTPTIELDKQGSLHQKFKKFLTFLNQSKEIELIYPRIDTVLRNKYAYLELPEKIPEIDINNAEYGIVYSFRDPRHNNMVQIRHHGYAFFEIK